MAKKGSATATIVSAINGALKRPVLGFASDPKFAVEHIPTGSLTMDRITGGGFPRGRHVELYGDEAAGKSYIAYRAMALAQQRGELCALVDAEKVFDEEWFTHCGGVPEDLIYFRPTTGEELIEVLMLFARGAEEVQNVSICTIDSVASILPREELEKMPTEGDDRTASRARLMSRLLRRVTTVNDKTLFLFTNQVIDKIGGYGGTTSPGGRALKFYASVRIEMKKEQKEKKARKVIVKGKQVEKQVVVGQWVIVRAEKQKTARPGQEGMFFFDYDRRCIDHEREIVNLGLTDGLITLTGKKLEFEDEDGSLHSGIESRFLTLLREDPELAEQLEWAISERTKELLKFETDEVEEDDEE
jgi:recombination protein RecA